MMQCPVCDSDLESSVCSECGFDPSCDYESHPTFQPIAANVPALSAREAPKTAPNSVLCPNCGHDLFRFQLTQQAFQCAQCEQLYSTPHFHKLASEQSSLMPLAKPHNHIAADLRHTVVLHSDGTVTAVGSNNAGQCNVNNWREVVSVAAGSNFTLGLLKDGSVLCTEGRLNDSISSWQNIAAISAAYEHALALQIGGIVAATGSNAFGQCNVSSWVNITAIAAGGHFSVGLRSNGTVLIAGALADKSPAYEWTDITAIAAGFFHVVGLRADGTVVAAGPNAEGECNVGGWTDIVAVTAGYNHTVGLKRDGTIVTAGSNAYSPHRTADLNWRNIVAITSGRLHTIGICANRTLVAFGTNSDGQCDVSALSINHDCNTR